MERLTGGRDGPGPLIAFGATLLLVALCVPLAMRLDDRIDRDRPMYLDRDAMALLQFQQVAATGAALAVELDAGESIDIAGTTFRTAPGVRLSVTVDGDGATRYCVIGANQHDAVTEPLCGDGTARPDAS